MLACFNDSADFKGLDKSAFKFTHGLLNHPSLSLEHLSEVLPRLGERVVYSSNLLNVKDDFEGTFKNKNQEMKLTDVIDTLKTSSAYIMVNGPEVDSSFKELHQSLVEDVNTLMQRLSVGKKAIDPKLFLFIASPNSVTPFHIDRYSTFLMQFRGSKKVSIFPQWDERVVSDTSREAYIAYSNTKLPFNEEIDDLGECFDFSPGEALHIPFIAGHHIKNGPEDISISMSIIFNTEQSMMWRKAIRYNMASRKLLSPLGLKPSRVGQQTTRDLIKAKAWGVVSKLRSG